MFYLGGWSLGELKKQIFEWPAEYLVNQLHIDWQTRRHGKLKVWVTAFWGGKEEEVYQFWTSNELYAYLTEYVDSETISDQNLKKTKQVINAIHSSKTRF